MFEDNNHTSNNDGRQPDKWISQSCSEDRHSNCSVPAECSCKCHVSIEQKLQALISDIESEIHVITKDWTITRKFDGRLGTPQKKLSRNVARMLKYYVPKLLDEAVLAALSDISKPGLGTGVRGKQPVKTEEWKRGYQAGYHRAYKSNLVDKLEDYIESNEADTSSGKRILAELKALQEGNRG